MDKYNKHKILSEGGTPLNRLYRYVCAKGYGFLAVLVWNRVSNSTIWSEIGYGLCSVVLNWVCFLEEATSLSLGDKTISFLMFTPTVYVP